MQTLEQPSLQDMHDKERNDEKEIVKRDKMLIKLE